MKAMTAALNAFRARGRPAWLGSTSTACQSYARRSYTQQIVAENDVVLLRRKRETILTPPLTPTGRKIKTLFGSGVDQKDIIGKGIRDVVRSRKGEEYQVLDPTLDEYVRFSSRVVTPIYPADANLIVSLLDLHPTAEGSVNDDGEKFEIFEAGTGHGSLTLHLARAVHLMNGCTVEDPGAQPDFWSISDNPFVRFAAQFKGNEYLMGSEAAKFVPLETFLEEYEAQQVGEASLTGSDGPSTEEKDALRAQQFEKLQMIRQGHARKQEAYDEYKKTRRAIVHTLDISQSHSDHARKVIKNFKRGMYSSTIDFHVNSIPSYLESRLSAMTPPAPFLAHAILDLPGCHQYLELMSKCVKPNGTLILFCPSITQINTAVKMIQEQRMSWLLETVLELGAGAGVGGREWDVKAVRPRAVLRAEAEKAKTTSTEGSAEQMTDGVIDEAHESADKTLEQTDEVAVAVSNGGEQNDGWEMICRPKVGGRVSGGGFLAVFKAMVPRKRKD